MRNMYLFCRSFGYVFFVLRTYFVLSLDIRTRFNLICILHAFI
jgi:hypothetical protein